MTDVATDTCVFDLSLPTFTLEAGARLPHHQVRGWWWGPAPDRAWIEARARVLPPEAVVGPGTVVRLGAGQRLAPPASWPPPASAPTPDPEVPTLLVIHALTGDMRAGGPDGWWSPLVGPEAPLDPRRYRVLCFNNLGSCYGTTGAADPDFPRRADDARFPAPRVTGKGALALPEQALPATLTTWDQARSLLLALDALGVRRVDAVAGGSVGGMIALCLAALDPARFERVVPIAAAESATPWILGWSHVGRQAVLLDPGFPDQAERGLELARQIAHLSYRAEPGLVQRQGRRQAPDAAVSEGEWSSRTPYRMQTYLEHQGAKLRRRFDARAYLAQMDAMDHHDLARVPPAPEAVESWRADAPRRTRPTDGPFHGWEALPSPDPATSWGLSRLQARVLAVSIDTDQLYFPEHMVWLTERLRVLGLDAHHRQLSSAHGHDAFLIEWGPMADLLAEALALPAPAPGVGRSPLG